MTGHGDPLLLRAARGLAAAALAGAAPEGVVPSLALPCRHY